MLADTVAVDSYAGGMEPVAASGGSISPFAILAGIAEVGALAAIASSGSDDNKNSAQPQTPLPPDMQNPGANNPNNPPASPGANGEVHLSGVAQVGQTMTATIIDVNGLPDSNNIRYQWYANGSAITGATGQTYTITMSEAGKKLTVRAFYTDSAGNIENPLSYESLTVNTAGDTYPGGGGSGGGGGSTPPPGGGGGSTPPPGGGGGSTPPPGGGGGGSTPTPPKTSTPEITRSASAQGGVEITPKSGHDTLTVTYTDSAGDEQQVTIKLDTSTNTWNSTQ